MFCTLSGKVPTSPVVNRKTGRLYERRLIEKALQQTGGKCPETDEPIVPDDLIPLLAGKKGAKPLTVNATDLASVPAVLSHLQNQWDAADLERQQLRRSLRETRQELASALYRLDAAIRAIARLRADAPAAQADTTAPAALQNGTDTAAAVAATEAPAAPPPTTPDKEVEQPVTVEDGNGQALEADTKEPEKSSTNPGSADAKDEDMATAEKVVEGKGDKEAAAAPKSSPTPADATTERSVAAQSSDERGAATSTPAPTVWPQELASAVRDLEAKLFAKRKARVVPSDWTPAEDVTRFSLSGTASVRDADGGGAARGSVADLVTVTGDDGRETVYAAWRGGRVGGIRTKPMVDCGGADDAHAGGATAVWADAAFPGTVLSGGEDGVVRVWDCNADWKCTSRFGGASDGPVVGLQRHPVGSVALVGRTHGWEWREVDGGVVVAGGSSGDGVGYTECAVHPDGRLFAMGRSDGVVELVDSSGMKVVERLGGGGGDVRGVAMSEKGYQMAVSDGEAVRLWDLRKHKVVGEVRVDGRGRGVALDGMGEYGMGVGGGMAATFQAKKKTRVMGRVPVTGDGGDGGGGGRVGVAWSACARAVLVGCDNGDVLKFAAM